MLSLKLSLIQYIVMNIYSALYDYTVALCLSLVYTDEYINYGKSYSWTVKIIIFDSTQVKESQEYLYMWDNTICVGV